MGRDRDLDKTIAGLTQAKITAPLVGALRQELGATVSRLGGTIEDDGSIVLPDTILFEQGRAALTPVMETFLDEACEPWLRALMRAEATVAQAMIEGHASSEWGDEASPDEAYLNNLALSQARSQAALDRCLRSVADPAVRRWAHAHLAAVGYSSARPVLGPGGAEDPERSRRVVFRHGLDERLLLEEVTRDVAVSRADR